LSWLQNVTGCKKKAQLSIFFNKSKIDADIFEGLMSSVDHLEES